VTKIVHFDEVEVVFAADQIRPLINPLKSLLIRLPTPFSRRGTANLISTFIGDYSRNSRSCRFASAGVAFEVRNSRKMSFVW